MMLDPTRRISSLDGRGEKIEDDDWLSYGRVSTDPATLARL
jgi:hypothetical protein